MTRCSGVIVHEALSLSKGILVSKVVACCRDAVRFFLVDGHPRAFCAECEGRTYLRDIHGDDEDANHRELSEDEYAVAKVHDS
jgi:hypothetical protein